VTQDVDTEVFYSVGRSLFENAKKMHDAFAVNVSMLGETGAMAGTDDAGTAWAKSYDERVAEVLGAVNDVNLAMENYGGVVIHVGYNHAVAEHNATPNNKAPAPTMPPTPTSASHPLSVPPSAGGSNHGLFDSAIGLIEQIGVPVPNGDTEKIDTAAAAWDRLATVYQTTTVVEALGVEARIFSDSKTPEDDYIAKDIGELRTAAQAILDGCSELAESCREYKAHLDELREQLTGILEELAVELAVTAAISILSSFVSFGVAAVAGTAKAAQSITKYAKIIRDAIALSKLAQKAGQGVKKVADVPGVRKMLERIKNIGKKEKPGEKPPAPRPPGELEYNIRPERLDHTFADKHKLDGVVQKAGSREEAVRQMLERLGGMNLPNGKFIEVVTVQGEQVTVRGFIDNGVIKIGTAFIP
jgi:hypothetical protein